MAILKILKKNDETLRKKSREVTEITPRTLQLLDDMRDTLHQAQGCGLAAPQVGVLRRIVIIEDEEGKLYELINPKIVAFAGEQEEMEGCLSIPGEWGICKRPQSVTVQALDRKGKQRTYTGSGLLARAFCHELDHLDGVLYTDKAVRMLTPEEVRKLSEEE